MIRSQVQVSVTVAMHGSVSGYAEGALQAWIMGVG